MPNEMERSFDRCLLLETSNDVQQMGVASLNSGLATSRQRYSIDMESFLLFGCVGSNLASVR